jgi:hypothetical protein
MQKIEWGFISQILGANFSISVHTKSFLDPLRIGQSKSNRHKKFYQNLTTKFSGTGVTIFWETFWPPITRKRYEIGPPCLGSRLRP